MSGEPTKQELDTTSDAVVEAVIRLQEATDQRNGK